MIDVIKDMKEEALKLYSEGRVSLWRAAEMAGLSLWEMLDKAREKMIPVKYDIEDAKEDISLLLRECNKFC